MTLPSPRIVFMGSPEFAVHSLKRLAAHYSIVGVITQPDRPAGRKRKLTAPPVKVAAELLGLPVAQPERLRAPEAWTQLTTWSPDLIVVAAYGQILRQKVLDLPEFGCLNVHASLLPRWRGAAPIHAAIREGDLESGVTIMKMDAGLDTGPILSQRAVKIETDQTGADLTETLASLGAELLVDTLPSYLAGQLMPEPQDNQHSTYAPMLKKSDGELDFQQSAAYLARLVRAYQPWPGAFMKWQDQLLKVHAARSESGQANPGTRLIWNKWPAIGTAQGLLILETVQPAGKKPVTGQVFLNGARSWDRPLEN
jgi:methionyl-tRNA formyltransferase